MTILFQIKHAIKVMAVILAAAFISACSSTYENEVSAQVSNSKYFQSIDDSCEQQAIEMDGFAQQSGQPSQYLASAKAMLRCVDEIQFSKGHPDSDKGLRLMALSVLNLVKGGDIDAAHIALKKTQLKFPNKDLYFADYSSFFDTATALLEQQKLSRHQLAALNISSDLRTEIERHHYWLSH